MNRDNKTEHAKRVMAEEQRGAKKRRFQNAMITITAGKSKEKEDFYVHEDLLRESSPFFDAALSEQWKEGQERKISLPDDKPEIVAAFVEWLYEHELRLPPIGPAVFLSLQRFHQNDTFTQLYIFSDKIQNKEFANATIASWTWIMDRENPTNVKIRYPGPTTICDVYANTLPDSPVRRMLVFICKTFWRLEWLHEVRREQLLRDCPEFLIDLACASMQDKPKDKNHAPSLYGKRKDWFYDV